MSNILRFEAFSSVVEPEFWAGLAHHKLHSAQLDTARTDIEGEFVSGRRHAVRGQTGSSQQRIATPARMRAIKRAWGTGESAAAAAGHVVHVSGTLFNTNTIEEFKAADKGGLLRTAGQGILDDIQSGKATATPEVLWPFVVLAFSDLKKYRFYHWFAFPAITADPPDTVAREQTLLEYVGGDEDRVRDLARVATVGGAFLAKYSMGQWQVGRLGDWQGFFGDGVMLGFVDPSSHATRPGWPLRNLLAWLRHAHPEQTRIQVLCFRDALMQASAVPPESIVLDINVTGAGDLKAQGQVSGWERNEAGRLLPRMANLSASMDPSRLAESALDLNLQLMRWRLVPEIDLGRISATRALLLGAGTLGSYAARALLAWGVRKITFVDNGKVSFSNPARQPLYEFADSIEGKPKAVAAASALRRIFPNVDAQGEQLSIPMPGHPVPESEREATRQAVGRLEQLVESHDVVFLLTDSRESRWLATVLGALHDKLVVCIALGFDSFVAMRHGVRSQGSGRLGCYFCSDVVAPTDSLTDRTLDQQCTVTRPGLAPIASGMGVELVSTILQHPLGKAAAADADAGVFGAPPHQIRGYLGGFRQHTIVGHAYDKCTACSDSVLSAYREHGYAFLERVFNNACVSEDDPHREVEATPPAGYSYLETLTGLAQLHRETEELMDDIEWTDDDAFEEL
ncbi:Autophagy protein 7 [Linderina pennispora]|nr:Autophagy protein 7 [Linderina pennispora]